MKLFQCQHCGQLLYFENVRCERCWHRLGYLPGAATLSALEPDNEHWRALASADKAWQFCANARPDACNWLVPVGRTEAYCAACRHNRMIPDLSVSADWQDRFISACASSHPREDFAETWAHYLHIVDTLEMADAYGVSVCPRVAEGEGLAARIDFDPYSAPISAS